MPSFMNNVAAVLSVPMHTEKFDHCQKSPCYQLWIHRCIAGPSCPFRVDLATYYMRDYQQREGRERKGRESAHSTQSTVTTPASLSIFHQQGHFDAFYLLPYVSTMARYRIPFIIFGISLLLIFHTSADVLYATNAVAIDECALHMMNLSSGNATKFIGSVTDMDGRPMGIFGMCHREDTMFAINHLDQLLTVDLETAKATVIGAVDANGLYDLACPPVSNKNDPTTPSLLYSFDAQRSVIVTIEAETGQGRVLGPEIQQVDAISMDFDSTNGELYMVDLTTGALKLRGILPGVHFNQRHGTLRGRSLYSAFFEAKPSNIWEVNVDTSSVESVRSTNLDSTYTLAFVKDQSIAVNNKQ